jgi:hypothetical protein
MPAIRSKGGKMAPEELAGEWDDLAPEELQSLLAELGVQMTLEETEVLRQLLATAEDAETALELLAVVSKAA